MVKITMLRTVEAYKKGVTYEVPEGLANYWDRCGAATVVGKSQNGPSKEELRIAELNKMKRAELDELLSLYGSENPKKEYTNIKACISAILEFEKPDPVVDTDPEEDFTEPLTE